MDSASSKRSKEHRKVDIRKTHPGLYHALMTAGLGEIALAINFWTSNPTFNPYNIPKNLIGVIFFLLGIILIFFLNALRDLRKVRLVLAFSIGFLFFWSIANTQQFFGGRSSLQLPIFIIWVCFAYIPWLKEAPVNPMTEKD